jgi:hypothetical protein
MHDPRRSTLDAPVQAPRGVAPAHASRCVVWCDDPAGPPARLLAALSKHGLNIEICENALTAAAALARRARAPGLTVLVLVEPEDLPDAQRLAAMVERRWSAVRCWEYRGVLGRRAASAPARSNESLQPTPHQAEPLLAPEPVVPVRDRTALGGANLRLTGALPATPVSSPIKGEVEFSDVANTAPPRHLLTDAELDMLLAPEPEGSDPRSRG